MYVCGEAGVAPRRGIDSIHDGPGELSALNLEE